MKKPLKPSCNGLHRWRLLAFVTTTPGRTFTATPPEPLSAGDGSSLLLRQQLLFPIFVFAYMLFNYTKQNAACQAN